MDVSVVHGRHFNMHVCAINVYTGVIDSIYSAIFKYAVILTK